ncbi:MAG TPA: Na+/H+ antiporter subunit E [Candidatus Binatia bacterium]|nr:Na+/H+ antiporter subunit E [Candidatus Binatia bacterium]
MLHAAAMLAGLFALGLLLTQGWASRDQVLLAFGAALASAGAAMWLGGIRKNAFSTAPQFVVLIASRAVDAVRAALSTIRAALAADVTLKPTLVSVHAETTGTFAKAAAADLISAMPGSVVVETESDGMLVHVMNEDEMDAATFTALQRRTAALLGARS